MTVLKKMTKMASRIVPALLLFVTAGCSHLVYFPTDRVLSDPSKAKIIFEEVDFQSKDGLQLKGWLFPASLKKGDEKRGTVIQFHGNGENRTSHFFSLFWMTLAGYDVFAFDYRGYGGSEGKPSQSGLNQDAIAAIEFIEARSPNRKQPDIVLYGQSLGGAVLARALQDLPSKSRIAAVVIEGSFHSYRSIARHTLSRSWITFIFQPLAYLLISDEYSPKDSFKKISPIPLLVIHGEKDPMIPLSFGEEIFALAQEPKELLVIPGGKHIDSMFISDGKYRDTLVTWLETVRARK